MREMLHELALALCQIDSTSLHENACLEYLGNWLENHGFYVQKIPVDAARYNILVTMSEKPALVKVLLCSHIDTVAPYVKGSIDYTEGLLKGRGACDAKGIIASMVMTLLAQRDAGKDDVALLVTVGEELFSDGAKVANKVLPNFADFVIVGEPTDLRCGAQQKGVIVFELETSGVPAHSAMPALGRSAIHELIDTCYRLSHYPWPTDRKWGNTTINIGLIGGGESANRFAERASCHGIMRLSVKVEHILPTFKQLLGVHTSLNIHSACDPMEYVVPEGMGSLDVNFGSDAPHLGNVGKLLLCGPGSINVAHTDDESIKLSELCLAVSTYQEIINTLRRT